MDIKIHDHFAMFILTEKTFPIIFPNIPLPKSKEFTPPKGWKKALGSFPRYQERSLCIACGRKKKLSRHHIVPKRVLRILPIWLRSYIAQTATTIICRKCHDHYETRLDKPHRFMPIEAWHKHFRGFLKMMTGCERGLKEVREPEHKGPVPTGAWVMD